MKQFEIHIGCFYKYNGYACYVSRINDEGIEIEFTDSHPAIIVSAEELEPIELDNEYTKKYNIGSVCIISISKNVREKPTWFLFQHFSDSLHVDYLCYMKYIHELQLHYLLSCGVSITDSILSFYKNKSNNESNE